MEYAKTLIKHRAQNNDKENDLGGIEEEESWTFIGDPEERWEQMASVGGTGGRPRAVESDLNA